MLQENNARKGFFEPEQLDALLAELPPYLQPIMETAYASGWRIASELLSSTPPPRVE